MVLFHDLVSPDVAAGLAVMRDAGWRTMLYQTMQIMGVAWRGDVEPVRHQPDPAICWTLPRHLRGYEVSGWKPAAPRRDAIWWDGMTFEDRYNVALARAQDAEDDLQEARAKLAAIDARLHAAQAETTGLRAELDAASDRIAAEAAEADCLAAERDAVMSRALAAENALARLTGQIEGMTARAVQADRDAAQAIRRAVETADRKMDVLLATRAAQEARVQTLRAAYMQLVALHDTQSTEDVGLMELARWMTGRRPLIGLLRRSGPERIAAIHGFAGSLGIGRLLTDADLAAILGRRFLLGLLRRSRSSAEAVVACLLIRKAQDRRRAAAEYIAATQRT